MRHYQFCELRVVLLGSVLLGGFLAPGTSLVGAERSLEDELRVPQAWVDSAKTEPALRVMDTTPPKQGAKIVEAFQKRYPFVEVKWTVGNTPTRNNKVPTLAQRGEIITDILTAGTWSADLIRDLVMNISDLPALKSYPSDVEYVYDNRLAARHIRYWSLGYNTNLVPPERVPKKWEDLLDPWWKGKICLNAISHTSWYSLIWKAWGPQKASDFLKTLVQTNRARMTGQFASAGTQMVASGECSADIPQAGYQTYQFAKKKAPVGWAILEPVPVAFGQIQIIKGSPAVNSAKIYLNWLLSREGQEVYGRVTSANPAHPGLLGVAFNWPDLKERLAGKRLVFRTFQEDVEFNKGHPGYDLVQQLLLGQ